MNAPEIGFHPAAAAEAAAAVAWYADRDTRVAERFERELVAALERIAEGPERWPEYGTGFRKLLLRHFPYLVIYRVLSDTVQVVAVAHGHRRPGYWQSRLP